MNVELTMLAYSVAVLFAVILIQGGAGILANSPATMAGNRDNLPPDNIFCARAKRNVQNHVENMLLFAPLVLIAAVGDISNQWTVLGAQLFFYARLAHGALYLLGVPWLRTLAWFVGLVGTAMIFLVLIGVLA